LLYDLYRWFITIKEDKMKIVIRSALKKIEEAWTQMRILHKETPEGTLDTTTVMWRPTEQDAPGLTRIQNQIYKALFALIQNVEFSYDEICEFVTDSSKDPDLRLFIWFRVFLPAQAYALLSDMQSISINPNQLMPRVVLGPASDYSLKYLTSTHK
jgi:hypothetical protein